MVVERLLEFVHISQPIIKQKKQILFEYDNDTIKVHVLNLLRVARADEGTAIKYIFHSDNKLHKCTGVVWIGATARPPVQYDRRRRSVGAKPLYLDPASVTTSTATPTTVSVTTTTTASATPVATPLVLTHTLVQKP